MKFFILTIFVCAQSASFAANVRERSLIYEQAIGEVLIPMTTVDQTACTQGSSKAAKLAMKVATANALTITRGCKRVSASRTQRNYLSVAPVKEPIYINMVNCQATVFVDCEIK